MAERRMTAVQSLTICDPTDDRCVRHVEPQKLPGISVRHNPSCSNNLCSLFGCSDGGNWRINRNGTLDRAEWIKGWVMTQLLTRGYVMCEEHPLGKRGGGWWADVFRSPSFISGSKLWAIQWMHGGATPNLVQYAKQYAQQALQYLITWGIASSVQVDAFYISRGPMMGRLDHMTTRGSMRTHDRADPLGAVIQLHVNVIGPGVRSTYTLTGRPLPNAIWLWREYLPPHAPHTTGRIYERVS